MDVKRAVLNQNRIFNILKQAKINNRLSHAYLFYGEEGVGKLEMAYALACLFYCPNGGCLECEVCNSIINNNHMNVNYIGIEDDKKSISKEQIINLQEEYSKTSLVEGRRIYIVDGIDTATIQAQNSLLKFIEEPTNALPTVGIFIAKDTSNVVPTIISRCALEHFDAIPHAVLKKELIEQGYDELDSILAASLSNNINIAKEHIENSSFNDTKIAFLKFISLETKKDAVYYYLENLDFFYNSDNLTILLQWILLFLEDSIKLNGANDSLILAPLYDKIKMYRDKNFKSLEDKLKFVLDLFNKLKYNVSTKNIFHELLMKFI